MVLSTVPRPVRGSSGSRLLSCSRRCGRGPRARWRCARSGCGPRCSAARRPRRCRTVGSSPRNPYFESFAMPTITAQGSSSPKNRKRLPRASPFGQNFLAMVSLMTTALVAALLVLVGDGPALHARGCPWSRSSGAPRSSRWTRVRSLSLPPSRNTERAEAEAQGAVGGGRSTEATPGQSTSSRSSSRRRKASPFSWL